MEVTTTGADFMTRLKAETWPLHQHAESRPMEQALVQGTLPKPQYVQYLEQRHLIHRALEAHVRGLAVNSPALAQMLRPELFQESNLVADLEFFGSSPESVKPARATVAFLQEMEKLLQCEPLALLGCYYVFEGSKNGARFIARAVGHAYRLTGDGLRYLDPHGERQRELWARFKNEMNSISFTAAQQEAMIAAAKRTFEFVSQLDDELFTARI